VKARLIPVIILVALLCMASCKPQDDPNEQLWVTVDVSVGSPSQNSETLRSSSSTTQTSLIIAAPAATSSVTVQRYLNSSDMDRQLLNRTTDTVSLTVPLDTPMRLIRVNFTSQLALETITGTQPEALQTGVSDIFTISGETTSKTVTIAVETISTEGDGGGGGASGGLVLKGEGMQGRALSLTGKVTTLAGSGAASNTNDTGAAASFNAPHDICTDGTYLYVVDKSGNYIRRITIATKLVETIAGNGGDGNANGPGSAAAFNAPAGITTDGASLYVADQYNNSIRKIVIGNPWTVSTLAGGNAGGGTACSGSNTASCKDGTGTAAQFNWPTGITFYDGYLYVADMHNNRIRRVGITTGEVTTFAGEGTAGFEDNTTGTSAKFNDPHDLTTDGTNLYVADQNNNRIRKIVIATQYVSTLIGDGTLASTDGEGTAARTAEPEGITTDGTYLYFTDWGANTSAPYQTVLRRTVISTGATTTIAGGTGGGTACSGTNTTYCQDGTGAAALFYWAHDLATDGTYLYLADFYNHRIRRIE